MKIIQFILLYLVNSKKIINNNYPSCRNCIHYKPKFGLYFSSDIGSCTKFGTKNIVTDEITNKYAITCRNDETLCGINGTHFELETNINTKIGLHYIQLVIIFLVLLYYK